MPSPCWKSLPPKDKDKYPGLWDKYIWKWISLVIIVVLITLTKMIKWLHYKR